MEGLRTTLSVIKSCRVNMKLHNPLRRPDYSVCNSLSVAGHPLTRKLNSCKPPLVGQTDSAAHVFFEDSRERQTTMASALVSFVVLCLCAFVMVTSSTANELENRVEAYFADQLWPGDGPVIQDAAMVVRNGKIVVVGQRGEVRVPARATRHELGRVCVIPGLVAVESNLALGSDPETALTPDHLALDGFDFYAKYDRLLQHGLTSVGLAAGQRRLMPGQTAVVKLAGEQSAGRVLREAESMQILLTEAAFNPPTIYEPPVGAVSVDRPLEPTRPQLASSLAQAITGLRAIFSAIDGSSDQDDWLFALRQWRTDGHPFRLTARSRPEIRAALQFSEEYALPTVLVTPADDAELVQQLTKNSHVKGVILETRVSPGRLSNPEIPGTNDFVKSQPWEIVRQLHGTNLAQRVALKPNSDQDLVETLFLAGQFRKAGLTDAQALALVTSNPARVLGVSDRVGTLSEGRDADFVVLSGQPFEPGCQVLETIVNGRTAWSRRFAAETDSSLLILADANVMQEDGTFRPASIAVSNGRIQSLGTSVTIPPGATVMRWPGAYVTPGFIDCSANLGIGSTLSDSIPLGTKLGEQLARDDEQIRFARQGGITTVLLSSTRSPSPVVAFRLTDTPDVLADPVAVQFSIESNITNAESTLTRLLTTGKQYHDAWSQYERELQQYEQELAEYKQQLAKYEAEQKKAQQEAAKTDESAEQTGDASAKNGSSGPNKESASTPEKSERPSADGQTDKKTDETAEKSKESENRKDSGKSEGSEESDKSQKPTEPEKPKEPRRDNNLEIYRQLFAKSIPAIVKVNSGKGVELAIKLFRKSHDLNLVVEGAQACYEGRAAIAAEKNVAALIGPTLVGAVDEDPVNFAAELSVSNVHTIYQSRASSGARDFPLVLEHAIHRGLGRSEALIGLTQRPSSIFSLTSVGKLQPGMLADLVVFSGPPLDSASQVLAVMVDGKWVFQVENGND